MTQPEPILSHPLTTPCPIAQWTSGIYRIRNTLTGEFYIGQSRCIRTRRTGHVHELRRRRHHSHKLQSSFDRDGEEAFVFEVLSMRPPKWGPMGRSLGGGISSTLVEAESKVVADLSPTLNMPPRKGRKFGPRCRQPRRT